MLTLVGWGIYFIFQTRREGEKVDLQVPPPQESQIEVFLPDPAPYLPADIFGPPVEEERLLRGKKFN